MNKLGLSANMDSIPTLETNKLGLSSIFVCKKIQAFGSFLFCFRLSLFYQYKNFITPYYFLKKEGTFDNEMKPFFDGHILMD